MPKIRTEPPRSLLPDREQEICHRFREVRVQHRLKQEDVAGVLNITADRVRSYEYARAPLRYDIATLFCEEFDVNQRWLATGEPPHRPSMFVYSSVNELIPPRMLFSEVYDRLLSDLVEVELTNISSALLNGQPMDFAKKGTSWFPVGLGLGSPTSKSCEDITGPLILQEVKELADRLALNLLETFRDELREFLQKFEKRHRKGIEKCTSLAKANPMKDLDEQGIKEYVYTRLRIANPSE